MHACMYVCMYAYVYILGLFSLDILGLFSLDILGLFSLVQSNYIQLQRPGCRPPVSFMKTHPTKVDLPSSIY